MKIIACYNIKGGVGKTATAVNLAYLASHEGARTLIMDLDPQGAASFYFRVKPKIKGGLKTLMDGKQSLDELIKGTDYANLDLIPADFSFRNMDLFLEKTKNQRGNYENCSRILMSTMTLHFWIVRPVFH